MPRKNRRQSRRATSKINKKELQGAVKEAEKEEKEVEEQEEKIEEEGVEEAEEEEVEEDNGEAEEEEDEAEEDEAEEDGVEEEDEEHDDMSEESDPTSQQDEQEEEPKDTSLPTPAPKTMIKSSNGKYQNKNRCLILCSRGVTARYRHLLEDLRTLIPHHKKESKLDVGKGTTTVLARAVNDICEIRGCNSALFLECRKRGRDAYMWVGKTGGLGYGTVVGDEEGGVGSLGPSVRFHLTNVHTMDELRLTGNCMKGSRPVLSFDSNFEKLMHLRLIKALFLDVFGTPRGHPKSKPFVDRVMAFYYADGKIWVRNYQILEQQPTNTIPHQTKNKKKTPPTARDTSLIEIGPRFNLEPIRIFRGSFGGQTLYKNMEFVPPNMLRGNDKKRKGQVFEERMMARKKKKMRMEGLVLPEDPLESVFR